MGYRWNDMWIRRVVMMVVHEVMIDISIVDDVVQQYPEFACRDG